MNQPNATSEEPLDPRLPIIDPHHHLWKQPPFSSYPPYTIEQFAEDIDRSGHRIVGTVYNDSLVGYRQSGPAHLRVVGEIELAEKTVREYAARGGKCSGICAGVVGSADLTRGAAVGEVLDEFLAASPRFRGIRHMTAFAEELPNWGAAEPEIMLRPVPSRRGSPSWRVEISATMRGCFKINSPKSSKSPKRFPMCVSS